MKATVVASKVEQRTATWRGVGDFSDPETKIEAEIVFEKQFMLNFTTPNDWSRLQNL